MKVGEILRWLDEQEYPYIFSGNRDVQVHKFSSLRNYKTGSISWIKKQENYDVAGRPESIACAVVQKGISVDFPNAIYSESSKEVFFAILHHFWGTKHEEGCIGKGTVIGEKVYVHPTVSIGCNCSIIGNVTIDAYTVIEHNVIIQGNVCIGKHCHIQSDTVIGIDGFGYSMDPKTGRKEMVEHFGGVKIGEHVFIGSHVNIARGTIDDTVIGNGVKIAPSTHIGHNNIIGDHASIICSTLYGSVKIGRNSYVTASIIENQTAIGEQTVIGMGSVVTQPIEDHVIAYGIPARIIRENNSSL